MSTLAPLPSRYFVVAFLTQPEKDAAAWQLNLSSVGTWTPGGGWNDPAVATRLADHFRGLQGAGGKVLVSFGGGIFYPAGLVTADSVDALAQAIAHAFLGGGQPPPAGSPFSDWKPAFPDWHFDGVDLDLELSAGPPRVGNEVWVEFARAVKRHAAAGTLLSGAPQSPYLWDTGVASPFGVPFPGGGDGTCAAPGRPQGGDFLLSTDHVALFDLLLVQFYDQGDFLEFPGEKNFAARLCQFAELVTSSGAASRIFVGVAARGEGHNGAPPGIYDPRTIGDAIHSALAEAGGGAPWFGGVSGWQSAAVTDFVDQIVEITGGVAALYGYQRGDPDW